MSRYLEELNNSYRNMKNNTVAEYDRRVLEVYNDASNHWHDEFIRHRNSSPGRAWVAHQYSEELRRNLIRILDQANRDGAGISFEFQQEIMEHSFNKIGADADILRGAVRRVTGLHTDLAAEAIIRGDIYRDGLSLSNRVWRITEGNGRTIQHILAQGLAGGLDAGQLSRLLVPFMQPGVGHTWDNEKIKEILGPNWASRHNTLVYEALRLARTTITHAATLAQKRSGIINPYHNHVIWVSAHASGRTCKDCIEMDGTRYTLRELPYDHPNGLCWHEPSLDKSLDEITDDIVNWLDGGNDPTLDRWWQTIRNDNHLWHQATGRVR